MLGRLKFELDDLVDEMLNQLPDHVWTTNGLRFADIQMGGGQFIQGIVRKLRENGFNDENIRSRVFGFSENEFYLSYVHGKFDIIGTFDIYNEEKVKNMKKFDVVVGNPPYQNKNSKSDAGKLYIDITKQAMNVVSSTGIILFLTPETIVRDGRNKFSIANIDGIKEVDYTVNEYFTVGVNIIKWVIDKSANIDKIKVINKNKTIDYRTPGESLVDSEDLISINLIEKIKSTTDKLFMLDQTAKNRYDEFKDGLYKVYSNVNKNKIIYTDRKPVLYGKRKLAISLSSSYSMDMLYDSYDDFGQLHVMTNIDNLSDSEIENLKSFLFNKYSIAICKLYRKVTGQGMNAILYSFPTIDVGISYNDDDVKNVFNLSEHEVKILDEFI